MLWYTWHVWYVAEGVFFYRDRSLRCPSDLNGGAKSAATACQNLRKYPRLQTKTVLARPSSDMAHIIGSIGGTQADSVPIKRALLSVSDKTGSQSWARPSRRRMSSYYTGGTAKRCERGLQVQDVADYTGFPEMLGAA